MGRPVVLSNGQVFVGLNENGLVHDFYYPYVGLENLTNARSLDHKIGVFVDNKFSWTDDGTWELLVLFEPDALISVITMVNKPLGVTLHIQDTIDYLQNVFLRRVQVHNTQSTDREIRLFMHQVFQISRAGRGDTALYVPDSEYVLDYKGSYCMAIGGRTDIGSVFDQYAVGNYAMEGKDGTFMDAEDGELSDNPVEHGGVDSVIRFSLPTKANASRTVDYWIAVGGSQNDVEAIHEQLKVSGAVSERFTKTREYWQTWLNAEQSQYVELPEKDRLAIQQSLLVIKAHCDKRGSILASGDSSIFNYGRDYYCYCWPRDAAYALWPLIRTGHYDEAKQFFAFAADVMHPDGYMMHKYQPDRAIGSTWHPLIHNRHRELAIQEDETASMLFMLNEYYEASKDTATVRDLYDSFVVPCANFMVKFKDDTTSLPHASYDLWEQHFATFTYTVSIVIAGLEAAAKLADMQGKGDDAVIWQNAADDFRSHLDVLCHPDGYFRKSLLLENDALNFDNSLDISSLYGPYMYAKLPLNDPRLAGTVRKVEKELLNTAPIGGVIRYQGDDYFLEKKQYGGNPWIVCTMWLAQYYISARKNDQARELINWALDRRYDSGILSEQFDPETGTSIGVAPLVWSHAELINTMLDYYDI